MKENILITKVNEVSIQKIKTIPDKIVVIILITNTSTNTINIALVLYNLGSSFNPIKIAILEKKYQYIIINPAKYKIIQNEKLIKNIWIYF